MEYRKFNKKTAADRPKLNTPSQKVKRTQDESSVERLKSPSGSATDISPNSQPDLPRLSPRQREVLMWAAHGKSSWETGRILGLTEATVKSYVGNACRKLNAQNKVHAVAICITRGEFSI